jgi:Spy/CpxP family protein refolding chaperone
MERSKILAAAFLAGAFTLGATVGFGFDRSIARAETRPAAVSTYEDFTTELGLTPEQKAAVDSILDEQHRAIDSLLVPVRPQMQAVRDGARREIAARLTPEQRGRYERFLARRAEEQARRRAEASQSR